MRSQYHLAIVYTCTIYSVITNYLTLYDLTTVGLENDNKRN